MHREPDQRTLVADSEHRMNAPRHVSTCITEWLDSCPFNLPDALDAIREEYAMSTNPTTSPEQDESTEAQA
jgi:hypothetical protein